MIGKIVGAYMQCIMKTNAEKYMRHMTALSQAELQEVSQKLFAPHYQNYANCVNITTFL